MFSLSGENKFQTLRQMAGFLLFSMGYGALKWTKSLKTGSRQVLGGLTAYFVVV